MTWMRNRRGNAAVTALSLSVLLGFGALAVDVAYVRVATAQLQTAVDAAVLAGAGYLDGSLAGVALAKQNAVKFAHANHVLGGFTLDEDDVQVGRWSKDTGFIAYTGALDDQRAREINALRIQAEHTGINAILAGAAFGMSSLSTRAGALAARPVGGPAAEVACWLPIALPACAFEESPTTNPPPIEVGPGNGDRMGWAHPDGANQNNVKGYFQSVNGNCSTSLTIGDDLPVMNGVGAANKELIKALNNDNVLEPTPWPYEYFPAGPPPRGGAHAFNAPGTGGEESAVKDANWGNTIAGPIALLDMGACDANGKPQKKWNKAHTIVGFTWGTIYDQNTANGNSAATWVQVDFLHEHELGSGTDPDAIGNVLSPDEPPVLVHLD